MSGLIDWAASRARMVLAFIVMSILAGAIAYVGLPKEGEPDIEIPALFVSVPFPGISAQDSEKLLVRPMETKLADLDGLKKMTGTAAENYGGIALEFEFGWDKTKTIADLRDRMNTVEASFPAGADKYTINELNFSEFPILIVNLSGDVPERTLLRLAKAMQTRLESLDPVLEAGLAGQRDEMLEVVIDPLRLETYNVTAGELLAAVQNNNQLIAAGEVETPGGSFSVKIPASFQAPQDVYDLPVKKNGDRTVTLGDLATIRLTFEDRTGTARFNGRDTVALQVVKRKGFNIIDTAALIRSEVEAERASWDPELRKAVQVGLSNDQSRQVASMVGQLEGSVLTAIALVMIVVLAALGSRSALLVGFAIPTSFLLTFAFLAIMGVTISNIVMFGLILAVGMLVDGAIVVVEFADRRISQGVGPMHAFTDAAKRMFWPVVSSTATTLCAFLPMLFWPGVAGEFMGMLPVTLIFVLCASLIVALIYLPVMGGVAGRISRIFDRTSARLRRVLPVWPLRALLVPPSLWLAFAGAMVVLNPARIGLQGNLGSLAGGAMFLAGAALTSITMGAVTITRKPTRIRAGYRRSPFGHFIALITGNPVMPFVAIGAVLTFVVITFQVYGANNKGVEFFAATEPEQAIIYVRARGNLSLEEKDRLVAQVEQVALTEPGVHTAFAFAGAGGLGNAAFAQGPRDSIGQIQIETVPWEDRRDIPELDGDLVLERLQARMDEIPGIKTEVLNLAMGPASSKPVHLRLTGEDWDALTEAAIRVREKFEATPALTGIEDTLPLPGIDWQIAVDVEKAGRFGADVASVGGMVQLVTRGILLDTMRVDSSDEEIEIRVRLPESDRVLSTLDTLKVRTSSGLVPLSNFITRKAVRKVGQIDRFDQQRFYDVKAGVAPGQTTEDGTAITPAERIAGLTRWLETDPLPDGVSWQWTGDQQEEADSQTFLMQAFLGALGLMFVILLAQFNSIYNAVLVLLAVVLSTTGVLIGMLVMDQPFGIIMTGTGIVALAGIVVNNNIVLIDTYQDLARYMPRIEAIIRTAEMRIRPVLLTTITTMAGLAPMMLSLSLDFINGGYSINSPAAQWWTQLATAVVFGLGIATVLTLVLTPAMLSLPVWIGAGAYRLGAVGAALMLGRQSRPARDLAQRRAAREVTSPEILWDTAWPPPQQDAAWGSAEDGEEHDDLPPLDAPTTALMERARRLAEAEAGDETEEQPPSPDQSGDGPQQGEEDPGDGDPGDGDPGDDESGGPPMKAAE
ncbi:efflux RND transporter permease subunit [Frigidibacter sp. ROC022]|uniref:efflux RND transporter permease subunit n=1 Tax=Frigidibacter sp. ROC022 TaxID=2971796 RepID=UPI00215B0F55|nr:efflux RND transporter permease subunit [Frigidibacter sp. ROC022]MCR8726328.1 efflux RND transporter permease subunit [Frigidibacter sp. ROC022]